MGRAHRSGAGLGSVAVAAVMLLVLSGCRSEAEPGPVTGTVDVEVFFTNELRGDPCGDVFPIIRSVDADDPVRGALEALLEGPTAAEEAEGYGGWFSPDTARMLRGVEVTDGTAWVDLADLRPVIPNASTSCGSGALLAMLDGTVLQFPDVDAAVYTIDGDAEAFYHWLQRDLPGEDAQEEGGLGDRGAVPALT